MAEQNALKGYHTKLTRLNRELDELKRESSTTNGKIVKKKRDIKDTEARINRMCNGKIIISEHAIIRYLERIENIDIEAIKDMIVDEKTRGAINVLTSGTFPIKGGKIEVINNVVTTVKNN